MTDKTVQTPHSIHYEILKNENRFVDLAIQSENALYFWEAIRMGQLTPRNGEVNDTILEYLTDCADRIMELARQCPPHEGKEKALGDVFRVKTTEFHKCFEDTKACKTVVYAPDILDTASEHIIAEAIENTGQSRATILRHRAKAKKIYAAQLSKSHDQD